MTFDKIKREQITQTFRSCCTEQRQLTMPPTRKIFAIIFIRRQLIPYSSTRTTCCRPAVSKPFFGWVIAKESTVVRLRIPVAIFHRYRKVVVLECITASWKNFFFAMDTITYHDHLCLWIKKILRRGTARSKVRQHARTNTQVREQMYNQYVQKSYHAYEKMSKEWIVSFAMDIDIRGDQT